MFRIESLESRTLLSISPVDPSEAVPFQKFTIDSNQDGRALEKGLGDIDGDGRMDVIIGQSQPINGIYWYPLPPSGIVTNNWAKHTIVGTGDAYEDMILRDVNLDGAIDAIASIGPSVKWFENPRGQGKNPRTDAWPAHTIANVNAHDMVVADFDADGKFDLATNRAIYFQNSPDSWLSVANPNYARAGTGVGLIDIGESFRPITPSVPRSGATRPPPRDDILLRGAVDLVGSGPTSSPYALYWYENPIHSGGNPRTQTWVRRYVGPVYNPTYSLVGYTFDTMDVNDDGRMDIVTAQSEQPDDFGTPPAEGLAWWEAPADRRNGTWARHQIDVNITQVHKKRIADINLDGRPDIVVAEQEQSPSDHVAVLYKQAGDDWRVQVLSTGSGHNITTADIDGDGDQDILNSAHGVYGANPVIELYLNNTRTPAQTAPIITKQPISRDIDAGESATFVVATRGATPLSFQWQKDGVDLPGATGSTYTFTNATAAHDNSTFRVIVTNALGQATSGDAVLSVTPISSAYLSDLNPTSATNGWGPYERDRSNGDQDANDGGTITLNGVTYAKGLGVHATSDLRYAVDGQYQSFLADIGVDDEVGGSGSVVFQVWADGTQIYSSGTMTGGTATKQVNVSIAGRNELRLVVADAGNGNSSDHADWANARVLALSRAPLALDQRTSIFWSLPAIRDAQRSGGASIIDDLTI